MIILAVDTSTPHGSLTLKNLNTDTVFQKDWSRQNSKSKGKNSHSDVVTCFFLEALESLNIQANDIDILLTTVGPGSFTGIRVALNFIKALSYSINKPIYTIDTNELISINALYPDIESKKIICATNAQKNSVFFSEYEIISDVKKLKIISNPCLLELEKFELKLEDHTDHTSLGLGDGFEIYETHIKKSALSLINFNKSISKYPQSANLITYYCKSPESFNKSSWLDLLPLYLRGSEAEERLKKGLLKPLPNF